MEKVQFSTFASPWVGIPKHKGGLAWLVWFFGSHLLSRTGRQIYLSDQHGPLPSTSEADAPRDGVPEGDVPLLAIMAHPDSLFVSALLSFRRVVVFVNSVQDPTVPFVTGGFEKRDPFREANRWVKKERGKQGWKQDEGWRAGKKDKEYEQKWADVAGESALGGTRVYAHSLSVKLSLWVLTR